jgi:DNA-binding transcriptional MerR regulator
VNLEFHTGNSEAELDTKSPDAFRTISEVADDLDIPQHVLRFWETRFSQIKPLKRGGGRRYYRPDDVALLKGIRRLLYGEGYTIKGLQRILKEQGPRHVMAIGRGAPVGAQPSAPDMHAPSASRSEPADIGNAGEAPPSWRPDEIAAPQQVRPPADDHDDIAVLETVLAELTECQRVLRGVLQPQPAGDGA